MTRYRSKAWRAYSPAAAVASSVPSAVVLEDTPCRILGLDPGSRRTGYGLIEVAAGKTSCLAHGRIEVAELPLAERLARIYAGVRELVERFAPQEVAVEKVFVNRNVESALKLGQARGAAIAALGQVTLAEYAPRAIKLATVGFGGAEKMQVAHMIRTVLDVRDKISADAADALAIALCHAQHRRLAALTAGINTQRSA